MPTLRDSYRLCHAVNTHFGIPNPALLATSIYTRVQLLWGPHTHPGSDDWLSLHLPSPNSADLPCWDEIVNDIPHFVRELASQRQKYRLNGSFGSVAAYATHLRWRNAEGDGAR